MTLKEYLVNGLFRRSLNPRMRVHALADINLTAQRRRPDRRHRPQRGRQEHAAEDARRHLPADGGHLRGRGQICSLFDITLGFEQEATGLGQHHLPGVPPGRNAREPAGEDRRHRRSSPNSASSSTCPVRNYSAGMLMRLAFAIATAIEPEILLIDEVLAVGDLAFQMKARARMRELMSASRLMVVVSHDLNTDQGDVQPRAVDEARQGRACKARPRR